MKKLWLILLMAIMIMIGVGCQDTQPQPENEVETLGKEATFELSQLFSMEKDFTYYYEGSVDYGEYRTIVDIQENRNDNATYILMEGQVDDLSGGESGDTSFIKKIKVFDSGIDLAFSNEWIPLLRTPLKEGTEWTGFWYDQLMGAYGNMTAKTRITEITDNTVTTELTPIGDKKYYKDYKVVTTYEVGKGIVSQIYTFPSEEGQESYHFEVRLSRTSKIPDSHHIRRYVNPENNLGQFYQLEDSFYKSIIGEAKAWVLTENDLTDKNIEAKYSDLIDQLPESDIKSISTAKKITYLLSEKMANPENMITKFIQYYEDVINDLNSKNVEDFLSYEEINEIYLFDDTDYSFYIDIFSGHKDPTIRAKALALHENGIGVSMTEGMYYFSHQKGFIYDRFTHLISEQMREYLKLKDWFYQPITVEGYLRVSIDELVQQMIALESFSKKYSDTEQAKWAESEAELLANIYAVPGGGWVYSNLSQTGKLDDQYKASYEMFIREHKDSAYYELVNSVYTYLKNNSFLYSMELDQYLKEKGLEPYLEEEIYNTLIEKEKQLDDFEKLMETKEQVDIAQNEKTVTVKNGEELINAIASNTTIYLEQGTYFLPYNYSGSNVNIDYGEVRLNNIENLVLLGIGEEPVTVISEAYGEVFTLSDCNNICFSNLRIGHLQAYCKGGVISISDCSQFTLHQCILFGCGFWGFESSRSKDVAIVNTLISDCNTYAVSLTKDEDVNFNNCAFRRNGQNVVKVDTCTSVSFEKVEISENKNQSYGEKSVFAISNSQDIKAINCIFTDNKAKQLVNNEDQLIFESQK